MSKENAINQLNILGFAPEPDMEELHNQYIKDLKESPNNLSFWFPKIKDCGIRVPETFIVPVPVNIHTAFFGEDGEKGEILIHDFVKNDVMPVVEKLPTLPFIKNGCFSDKFDFRFCCPADKELKTIIRSVTAIQAESLCYDTGGSLEIVLRERIPAADNAPRIYRGMPLNTEFRVFYDFDSHRALYVHNYWDKDYCEDAISRHPEDGKVFATAWPEIDRTYRENAQRVIDTVDKALAKVDGLTGIWSVDILLDCNGCLWLIDMAVGCQSAYWDYYMAQLCKNFKEIDEFIAGSSTDNPQAAAARAIDYTNLRLNGEGLLKTYIQTAFIGAYVKPLIGKELKGDDAQFFGVTDFVGREIPSNEVNENLIKEAEMSYRNGYESPSATEEYKRHWQSRWDELTNILFIRAVEAFLNKKNKQ